MPSKRPKAPKAATKETGRTPQRGANQVVSVKLPAATVQALDQWAELAGISRSGAMRVLVEAALERLKEYTPIKDSE